MKNQFENSIETVVITPYRIEPSVVENENVTRVEVWSNKRLSIIMEVKKIFGLLMFIFLMKMN